MSNEHLIAWIDVETDGLKAQENSLLEIACLVTDPQLNILDEKGFESVILYSPDRAEEMRKNATPFVREMHDKTGLWEKLPFGEPLSRVDYDLHSYLRDFSYQPRMMRLGGNSVRLDLNFVEEFLPNTYSHLHYRFIDVTTVTTLMDWWGNPVRDFKDKEHSAMSDIRESIEELRKAKSILGF